MTNSIINKIFLIAIYIMILILIPLFLDFLFKITVRHKRKNEIITIAKKNANKTNKPLIIFNGISHGVVDTNDNTEKFSGDISEIISQMGDNTCVIIVSETLEYIDDLPNFIDQLKRVSGNDLYVVSLEKNSPRIFWDYNIKNVMNDTYTLPDIETDVQHRNPNKMPNKKLTWMSPNNLQIKTQHMYEYFFNILPYNFIIEKLTN